MYVIIRNTSERFLYHFIFMKLLNAYAVLYANFERNLY